MLCPLYQNPRQMGSIEVAGIIWIRILKKYVMARFLFSVKRFLFPICYRISMNKIFLIDCCDSHVVNFVDVPKLFFTFLAQIGPKKIYAFRSSICYFLFLWTLKGHSELFLDRKKTSTLSPWPLCDFFFQSKFFITLYYSIIKL